MRTLCALKHQLGIPCAKAATGNDRDLWHGVKNSVAAVAECQSDVRETTRAWPWCQ